MVKIRGVLFMRCPECNWYKVFEDYNRNTDNGDWQREIYCPCCHHSDKLPVTDDETLEEFAERELQRIHNSVKRSIVSAFRDGGDYHDGVILQDLDDNIVKVDIHIVRDDDYFKKITNKQE